MPRHAGWDATVEEVMANWPVTGVVVVAEKISYRTRRVLRLRCDQGEFAAKIDLQPGSVDTEQRLAVLEHLAARGFRRAPTLLRTCAGTRASCTPSRTITLLEYIPAPVITGDADALAGWRDLGAAAARLNGLADYTVPFALPVHQVVAELAARAAGTPFDGGVRALLRRVETLADVEEMGLIHGEINGGNAGRRANGEVVLLDWDQAGVGPLALEYGYPLIAAFVSEDLVVDHGSARAFYGGYTDAGGQIDNDRLFDAALLHALRYMWFGDVHRRWERILHAVKHEDLLTSLAVAQP